LAASLLDLFDDTKTQFIDELNSLSLQHTQAVYSEKAAEFPYSGAHLDIIINGEEETAESTEAAPPSSPLPRQTTWRIFCDY
jgi:hypothetical protein